MAEPFIHLDAITVRAGARQAFEDTCWTIETGQHWAVWGETGAGKTILARAISRKLPLVSGQIWYHFDDAGARTHLHPGEVLTLSAETHREFLRPYAEYHQARWQSFEGQDSPTLASLLAAHAAHPDYPLLLDLLNLVPLLERKLLHLSNGESRKALIARLWLAGPRLLILDDPYVGLDAASRAHLSQALAELAARGAPQFLFLTPRSEEIPPAVEQVLVVRHCQVAACGPRAEVLAGLPATPAAAAAAPRPHPALAAAAKGMARALAENPAAAASETVRLENVSVRYDDVRVLDEVSWVVRAGERWALQGPNGAGKSTLLSLILGDNPQAYANRVFLFGRRRGSGESIWELKRKIGWVSPEQQVYYPPAVTCREVVWSGFFDSAGLYREPSAAQASAAGAWLTAFGLEDLARQPFPFLSTGQQRLALLARALVKNPPLLVLDEPCQGLDEAHRREFTGLLDRLCALAPLTLIYVTHYAEELPQAVNRRLHLERGRVAEQA